MEKVRFNIFKKGLGRRLLFTILLLAILPTMVIGITSYIFAANALQNIAVNSLKDISQLQSNYLKNYFNQIQTNLRVESARKSNIFLIKKLNNAIKLANISPSKFVESNAWKKIYDEHITDLQYLLDVNGYYDVFLINLGGDIVFTLARENDLGTNLFNGKYANTKFSKAAKQSLVTGKLTYSDRDYYEASADAVSDFFVTVMHDKKGKKIGLIAFQVKDNQLDEIIQRNKNTVKEISTYLIGMDLILRSSIENKSNSTALVTAVDTETTREWIKRYLQDKNVDINNISKPFSYIGLSGHDVIGVWQPVNIAGVSFAIVAEINESDIFSSGERMALIIILVVILTALVVINITLPTTKQIVLPILQLENVVSNVANGDLEQKININEDNEIGFLSKGFSKMLVSLKKNKEHSAHQEWLQSGISGLNDAVRGEQAPAALSRNIISFICKYLEFKVGAFYIVKDEKIRLTGSYAFHSRKKFVNKFLIGDGIVGQAVLEKQVYTVNEVPDDYLFIETGLGKTKPKFLMIAPIIHNQNVVAVIEVASLSAISEKQNELIRILSSSIAIAVLTALSRDNTQMLLEQTQVQAEELQAREEELRENNTVLEEQSDKLEKSAAELEEKNNRLQAQQEELRASNEELEVKANELENSGTILEEKNNALDLAKIELEKKADDLAKSSQYKSEFLANMSHELRTPLNSLLILAKLLSDNKEDNLSQKQVEYAVTIHDSGTDLLNLINDILDLSKIEAGRMDVHIENVSIDEFCKDIQRKFKPMANKNKISFDVSNQFEHEYIVNDGHKMAQIIKNLLSNAFKFTSKGGVELSISEVDPKLRENAKEFIQIAVTDSGIGISDDKQISIFEAFQQEDGTTNRKFGGTGLGLSISRELAKLLGGEILLSSEVGKGSTFSLLVKKNLSANNKETNETPQIKPIREHKVENRSQSFSSTKNVDVAKLVPIAEAHNDVADDRKITSPEDNSLLIIEDDAKFAAILTDVARDKGFKVLVAEDGETGLHFADFYRPSGIILDIGLPGINGWDVIGRLKNNLATRHIPVHFMSGEDKTTDALRSGALGYLTKPVNMEAMEKTLSDIEAFNNQPVKKMLLIEDNEPQSKSIIELLGDSDLEIESVVSGSEAIKKLKKNRFDCIVLDLGLPDMDGADLLEKIKHDSVIKEIPVVIYSGRDLDRAEKAMIEKYASSVIIKNARSPEILLDQTALFLHRVEENISEDKRNIIKLLHDTDSVLMNKNILVVDDDMRNVFALTTMLRDKDMIVTTARNGIDALEKLENMESPDMVLMDIMMPEMDGYEAMEKIREQDKYSNLVIIALTAKAMKGDRAKCIEAGANDYLSKPIDTEKLLSIMRVWLYR